MIRDSDDSKWRIQSYFITEGTSIKKLEKIINEVISEYPNIKKETKATIHEIEKIKKEIEKLKKELKDKKSTLTKLKKKL